MAKWRSPSFKCRRGFDLFANIVKIQQRTPRRCSYFRFVSFRLSNLSKPEKIPEIWSSLVLQQRINALYDIRSLTDRRKEQCYERQLFDSIVSNSAHKLHHLLPLKQIQFRNQCNFKFRKMRTNRNTTTFIPFKSNRQNFYTYFFPLYYRVILYYMKLFLNDSV